MAAKKNKEIKNLSKKKGYDQWQWLNLPREVIQLLYGKKGGRRRSRRRGEEDPLHRIVTIGTTKSWFPATNRCSRSGERRWPELCLLGNAANISSATNRQEYFYGRFVIQNAATNGRQIMAYYTDEGAWIRNECIEVAPFDGKKRCIEFTSYIGFQGKFYALSSQGALAVIEDIDSQLTVTRTSSNRVVPSVSSRFFKEYLIEMNGEIFLVFFIHQKSVEIVDQLEVFSLCLLKFKWIKVERIPGKAVFLDKQCHWVNSAEIGCRGNCIYFTQGSDNGWWIYDMENGCISPASWKI